jgi:hypothetical protein
MAKIRFELDPDFEAGILRSEGVRDLLARRVAEGVRVAKRVAPKREGDLRDGITGDVGIDTARDESGRFAAGGQLIGRVASSDWKTVFHEFGTSQHEKTPMLRAAGEAMGDYKDADR